MSLHFIIDGYNLIKQTPGLNKSSLEGSRASLIQFIKVSRPQGSQNNRVTVVFDGQANTAASWPSYQDSGIRIIFSQGMNADEKIKELVETADSPKNIVVVTNDRDIQICVRRFQARVKTVQEFTSVFKASPISRKGNGLAFNIAKAINNSSWQDKLNLSAQAAAKITDEMKRLWL